MLPDSLLQQQGTAVSGQVGTQRAVQRDEENNLYYSGKLLLTLRQDSQGKVTAGVRQMIQLEKTKELLDTQILFPTEAKGNKPQPKLRLEKFSLSLFLSLGKKK